MAIALREARRHRPTGSPGRAPSLRTETCDDVDSLAPCWPESAASLPSSQFGWLRASLTAFGAENCRVLTVATGETFSAASPLVGKRAGGLWRLVIPGADELGEPAEPAWTDHDSLRRLAASLACCPYPVHLPRVPIDSPLVQALRHGAWGRAWCAIRPARAYPYIVLDESWVEPERHLLTDARRRLAQVGRAAERQGPVVTEIHSPDLGELPELLDTALEVGRARAEDDAEAALRLDRAVFYRQYAESACIDGTLRICLLRIGDRVAAAHLAVESEGALWLLHAAADSALAHYWPAQLLARETIRYAAEANLETLEFWGTPQDWIRDWRVGERPCVSIRLYPLRVQSLAALSVDAAAGGWQRWRQWRRAQPASHAGRSPAAGSLIT